MSETGRKKLTVAQRKALSWVKDREPVSAFPCDGTAPSLRFVKQLEKAGLVEKVGVDPGRFGFSRFCVTSKARGLLA